MEWISGAIAAIGEFNKITTSLTAKSKTTNIHKKLIIRELRDNLIMFKNVLEKGLSADSLIDHMSNEKIKKAIEDDFDFKLLKKGVIKDIHIKENRNRIYKGWTAEDLIEKIDEKTEELKNLKKLNKGTIKKLKKSNINLMLSNQFHRMQLLARFINK
jgi:hypothetical protein